MISIIELLLSSRALIKNIRSIFNQGAERWVFPASPKSLLRSLPEFG